MKVKTLIVFNRLMNEINYLTSAHDVETLNTFRPPKKTKNKTKLVLILKERFDRQTLFSSDSKSTVKPNPEG